MKNQRIKIDGGNRITSLINRLDASLRWHDRDFLKLKNVRLPWQG
jgi:hypothetical protein